jgi:hypothetical protein
MSRKEGIMNACLVHAFSEEGEYVDRFEAVRTLPSRGEGSRCINIAYVSVVRNGIVRCLDIACGFDVRGKRCEASAECVPGTYEIGGESKMDSKTVSGIMYYADKSVCIMTIRRRGVYHPL